MNNKEIFVIKKDRSLEIFNSEKIWNAISKSADRVFVKLSDEEKKKVSDTVLEKIPVSNIAVADLHNLVEISLDECGFHSVAEAYRSYRNYKNHAKEIWEAVDKKTLELSYKEDRSNANCDSTLVSTKRSIIYGECIDKR